jgi:hypothetical protein
LTGASYRHRKHWSPPGTWNEQRVVAALKDWRAYTGSAPRSYEWAPSSAAGKGRVTARVRLWSEQYPRWPSTPTVCTYFGRWSSAIEAAGLQPHARIAPGAERAARVEAAQRMAKDGVSTQDIAAILGISPRTVRAYLRAGSCAECGTPVVTSALCPRCASRRATRPARTRSEAIFAIRAWAEETGHPPRAAEWAPSEDPASKWAREYPRWPGQKTLHTIFGTWMAALEAAGYPPNRRAWDAGAITVALQRLARETGRVPMAQDLERADMPALGTIHHYFGSFGGALRAAGFPARRRRWDRHEILAAMDAYQRRHGRLPGERDWRRSTDEHPHASTARREFGSWRHLLRAYDVSRQARDGRRRRERDRSRGR